MTSNALRLHKQENNCSLFQERWAMWCQAGGMGFEAQLRDAFRLLAKGVPDEQELGQPRRTKAMGEFKAALQNWGLMQSI